MPRRTCFTVLVLLVVVGVGGARLSADDGPLSKVAFGSCADQNHPCPVWKAIGGFEPQRLVLLGDNIYADLVDGKLKPATPERIAAAYRALKGNADFAVLQQRVPILATWDDHDYGNNDAGVEWEHKDAAAKLFHDFFGTPVNSPRRTQAGIYHAEIVGPPGKRVQFLLLDTRYFRTQLEKGDTPLPGFRAKPYIPADSPSASMLGEAQWKWLETQLKQPAEIRFLCSSIQVVSDEHPSEKWSTMPIERQRLYDLIRTTGANGVIVLSGDRHLGDISVDNDAIDYPLYDITASGLNQGNQGWRAVEPNRYRVAALPYGNHFGAIEIDWDASDPIIDLQLRHEDGRVAVSSRVPLSKLAGKGQQKPLPEGFRRPETCLTMEEGAEAATQFVVAGGRMLGNRSRLLLNSQSDYRNPKNLTVMLPGETLRDRWENADVKTFQGKTVRARGVIRSFNGVKQLEVSDPSSLELVDE